MNKRILAMLLILAAVSAPLTGCISPKEEPAYGDVEGLLPDWKVSSSGEGWIEYSSATAEMIKAHAEKCRERGFKVLEYANGAAVTGICSETSWIEIFDNSLGEGGAYLTYAFPNKAASGKIGTERAKELICGLLEEGESIVSIAEGDSEAIAGAGLTLFKCMTKSGPGEEFRALDYYVGENGAIEGRFDRVFCTDIDGDGEKELLTTGLGPTSGLFTLRFGVVDIKEGVPCLAASRIFVMSWGEYGFTETEDGPAFSLAVNKYDLDSGKNITQEPVLYPISFEDGRIVLKNTEGGDAPAEWAPEGFEYSAYGMREDIDLSKGLTVVARPVESGYVYALCPTQSALMPPFRYNELAPVSGEVMSELLANYGLPKEKLSVLIVELPAKGDSSVRAATEEERAEILSSVLGI